VTSESATGAVAEHVERALALQQPHSADGREEPTLLPTVGTVRHPAGRDVSGRSAH
jgi:hypothetical protein